MAENQLHSIGAGAPIQQQNFPSQTEEKQEGHMGAVSVALEVPNPAQAHHISVAGQQTILSDHHSEAAAPPEQHSIEHISPHSPMSSPRTQKVATNTLPKESLSTPKISSDSSSKPIGKIQLYDLIDKGKIEEFKQILGHLDIVKLREDGFDVLKELIEHAPNGQNKLEMIKLVTNKMGDDINQNKIDMIKIVSQKIGDNINDNVVTVDGETFDIYQTLNVSYLTYAVLKESSPEVLRALMENGADLSQSFVTPDDIHVLSRDKGLVLLDLFTSGKPSIADKNPEIAKNVMFQCVSLGIDKGVELLAERGVKLDVVDHNGNNLLHIASARNGPNALAMVKLLISKGVNINVANKEGFQPLALAILSQPEKSGEAAYLKIINLLLQNNANIVSSNSGKYAFIYLSTLIDFSDANNESCSLDIADVALRIETQKVAKNNDIPGQMLLKDMAGVTDQLKRARLVVVYFEMREDEVSFFREKVAITKSKDVIFEELYPVSEQIVFPDAVIPMMIISCLNTYNAFTTNVSTQQLNMLNTMLGDSLQNLAFKKPFIDLLVRLYTLQSENSLDQDQMAKVNINILNFLCEAKDPKAFLSDIQKIQTILDLNLVESFDGANLKEGETLKLNSLHTRAMDKLMGIFKMNPAQFEEMTGVFRDPEQFREPSFLTVWSARLSTIEPGDRERILDHLRDFVTTVYKENTVVVSTVDPKTKQIVQKRIIDPTRRREKRYDISNDRDPTQNHLRAVFGTRPELFAKWKAGAQVDFNTFVEARISPAVVTTDFIKAHIGALPLPALKEFLDPATSKVAKENIKNDLIAQLKIKPKVANASIIGLQSYMIRFLELNPKFDGNPNTLGKMNQILGYLNNEPLTQNSTLTKEWGNLMGKLSPNLKYEGWTVVDTDNVQDLLMVGNEVYDSCQEMRREPKYTKCLLGSQKDGKYKLIAVKNKEGVIVSRAFARIVLDSNDPKNGKPVLFMEKMYNSHMADGFTKEVVREMFHARSEDMGIPLGSWNPKEDVEDSKTIHVHSLGGPAPEYVDAMQNIQDDPDDPQFDHNCKIISRNKP